MFKKQLDQGQAGDNVGVLLRGVQRSDVNRGMCLVKPGSMDVFRNFEAEIYVLKDEEGGRTKPFFSGYRPQCFLRTADVSAGITLPESTKSALPGDNVSASMKLDFPLPIEAGNRFALREGGKTVAAGVITKILGDSAEDIKEEEKRLAKKKRS